MSDYTYSSRRDYLWFAAILFLLFVLMSSGTTGSGDAMVRYTVAKSIVANGDIALETQNSQTLVGREGKLYTIYGVGQSLLFVVAEVAVQTLRALLGGDRNAKIWSDLSIGISSVIVLPLVTVLGLLCFATLLENLGVGLFHSRVTTLTVAVATPLLPYAKFHQEENQIAAVTFACALFTVSYARSGRIRLGMLAASLCWIPMWFRPAAIAESVPLACLVIIAATRVRDKKARTRICTMLVGAAAVTAAWLLFYNWFRFGSIFSTGYQEVLREGNYGSGSLVQGLLGPIIHPSKCIFLYSPLLIIGIIGLQGTKCRWGRAVAITGIATLVLSIVIPASLPFWGGDTSWGPRYEIAGQGLILVSFGCTIGNWTQSRINLRTFCIACILLGVCVQVIGVTYNYNLEYNLGLKRSWDYSSIGDWYSGGVGSAQIPMRVASLTTNAEKWVTAPPRHPKTDVEEYAIPAFLPWKIGQQFGATSWLVAVVAWLFGWLIWFAMIIKYRNWISTLSLSQDVGT